MTCFNCVPTPLTKMKPVLSGVAAKTLEVKKEAGAVGEHVAPGLAVTVVPILPSRLMWLTTGEKVYVSVPAGVGYRRCSG